MKLLSEKIRSSATDLSNHLACHHLTTLDLRVARGERKAPEWVDPNTAVIRERGLRHEAAYLKHLADQERLTVTKLGEVKGEQKVLDETLRLMNTGAEVIAQGSLAGVDWFGLPDILRRVDRPCAKWPWSYEVADTKLSRETKAATILQLSTYSELLEKIQGTQPEWMWVITPGTKFVGEKYRVAEYAAYFRYLKTRLTNTIQAGGEQNTYPEPVPHCDICRWFKECDSQRRSDDHLSLVAGIRRQQQNQLEEWGTETMAKLAVLPIPLQQQPKHGSREGIERVREQARVQVVGREDNRLIHERLLPVIASTGFCRLPEPSGDDVFLDFEGDPFVGDSGLQYMFGIAFKDQTGELAYESRWALNREQEKLAFEWLVDETMLRRKRDPGMHVYHFGAYEPATLKRLMGMYATREDELDRMLRAGVLVDLHQAFKQGVRASVEEYSLKKIEAFYTFIRKTPLDSSRAARRYVEHRLELGWDGDQFPAAICETMDGYNREDCFSTAALRDWLETERQILLDSGTAVPRFVDRAEDASEELDERQQRVAALVARLTNGLPVDQAVRTLEQQAQWLLAQLLDWHRRENKAAYWEGYRLADLDDSDLLDEKAGLGGLNFLGTLRIENKIPVHRYSFEKQETDARVAKDLYYKGEKFGRLTAVDVVNRTVDVKKTKKTAQSHPAAAYLWDRPYDVAKHAGALFRLGTWVAENALDSPGPYRAGRDLLLRKAPKLSRQETLLPLAGESSTSTARRIVCALDDSLFAIQGPPGAGKTFTGARMICALVKQGKRIAVTAPSHAVIRKLLEEVLEAAHEDGNNQVRCMQRCENQEPTEDIAIAESNEHGWAALASGEANVLAGTSWLWVPEQAMLVADVLFIDEAGQMGLADVLAASQSARNLVLIGDPQQLERPSQGSHPDGAEKSALEHLLGGRKTISEDAGFLLPTTWRLHPHICGFTSELFYEDRLHSEVLTQSRVLQGHEYLDGAGLWFVPVSHDGNRSSSIEEVGVVEQIVASLFEPEVRWYRSAGNVKSLARDDILVVAPYNAQVADLSARLPGIRIGTVDKFQGQQAPIVIYSMTTSSPDEVPRGMEFFYSLNRLNVATSRAMSTVIVVGNPKLFEPDCRTPRQMQLANALCRFRELATEVRLGNASKAALGEPRRLVEGLCGPQFSRES
jgi:predicted RecB family nuclease